MKTEEPEGYGALGVLSKEEAELEKVYDTIIKVGTLDGIRILAEQLKQERNKAIDEAIEVAYNHDVIDNWYQLKLKLESLKH